MILNLTVRKGDFGRFGDHLADAVDLGAAGDRRAVASRAMSPSPRREEGRSPPDVPGLAHLWQLEREGWSTDGIAFNEPIRGLDLVEYRRPLRS